ncbi:DsbA family protein [Conexibacter sp. JD483]|uniref:DsbA family protein n=1 Tax=unclassified Conexibacter TaxID=2627773 RepID=UPI002727AD74|nr:MULTISPECIES: DsbA family protein [unclassified Conexibacter]MDO8186525.1 DsbA family protein [Conexibacter sp. CPCC 205706]MDO8200094.1 DsbA family protein [Conexibacter sp. CPCC 205762]MDR9372192.1 DsbA family protein [Conexibacter sp. JD483]
MTPSTATPAPLAEVVEYTDPGCIWSWSSEPLLRWLRARYGDQLAWRRVFGVQVDDLARTHPGRDPVADAEEFRAGWLEVAAHTRAPVTARLAWMHSSTLPASRAAKAAEAQGPLVAEAVLRRLREAVFVGGEPADSDARVAAALRGLARGSADAGALRSLARGSADVGALRGLARGSADADVALRGIPALDLDRLLVDAVSARVAAALEADWAQTRRPRAEVIGRTGAGPNPGAAKPDGEHLRYGFPTLVVRGSGGERVLAGWQAPLAHAALLEEAAPELVARAQPEPAAVLLERHGSLTEPELELLTSDGAAGLPADAVRVETATTPLWRSAAEAAAIAAGAARSEAPA